MQAFYFAVIETPQEIGGAVAAEAKIESAARGIELLPGGLEVFIWKFGLVVVVGNGVAEQQQLCVGMVVYLLQHGFVAVGPPGLIETIRWGGGGIGCRSLADCRRNGEGKAGYSMDGDRPNRQGNFHALILDGSCLCCPQSSGARCAFPLRKAVDRSPVGSYREQVSLFTGGTSRKDLARLRL